MHDPMTVAFDIRYPWKTRCKMGDGSIKKGNFRKPFITIWHVDPEKDGTDDSCGWFLRARHLDKDILKKIVNDFEFEWDRTFRPSGFDTIDGQVLLHLYQPPVYSCGWFHPNGDPHLSPIGITVNMFWRAAYNCLGSKRAKKYMNKNPFGIIHFAENNVDSLYDGIIRKFEKGCNEEYTKEERKKRIHSMASCIYAYIMRDVRPWYKHPKWHIHHWRVQIHPLQKTKRLLFDICDKNNKTEETKGNNK